MMEIWNNFAAMLKHVGKHYSNPKALNFYHEGQWVTYSTQELLENVKYIALGLIKIGLTRGECIGLMSQPCPQWTIANLAIIMAGGVLVPLFPNIAEENFIFEVNQTNLKKIFIDRSKPIPILNKHKDAFELIIDIFPTSEGNHSLSFERILELGKQVDQENKHAYEELENQISADDLAMIIYTSATTGTPKGVEVTHRGLTRHISELPIEIDPFSTRYLNILPLAHIFGHSLNLTMVSCGASIYYMNDVKNLGNCCREIHPTILVVVPRLLEKLYAKMEAGVQNAGFMKRHLGQWAFDLANQEENSLLKYLVHPIVDAIVYSNLREALGGSIIAVVSGGAPLDPHLNHFFQEIGVPIYEGWGLTEACPVTVNRPGRNKIGTVGQPLYDGIELKTTAEGEVLIRGTLLMRGYYKNPEATAKALDSEGWLHTGDKGEIDNKGFLTLHGRLKELFKTSTGEWVAPVPIEQMICRAPLIETAMVIAEGRKFASCLLFPNKEVLDSLKKTHDAENQKDEDFLNSLFVQEEMIKLFSSLNTHLNHWEKIHAYRFVPQALSIEEGEMTPSLKIRRDVVMNKYKHLIDAMYQEEPKI